MPQQYFIRRDGEVRGPCNYPKLLELGKAKKLKAGDELAHLAAGPWVNIESVVHKLRSGRELILQTEDVLEAVEVVSEKRQSAVVEATVDVTEVVEEFDEADIVDVDTIEAVDEDVEEFSVKGPPKLNKLKKQKQKKKRKARAAASTGPSLGDRFSEIWDVYGSVLKPALILCGVALVGLTAVIVMRSTMKPSAANQKLFMHKTTREWMNLEREGKARRQEVLWQDQRWMSLEQVLGLDWEATVDLLDGVADEKTRSLAETALGKYEFTPPGPLPEHVVKYFKHESQPARLWAARIASRVKPEHADYMAGQLETLSSDSDAEVKAAAEKSIEVLKASPES